jgi:hypothetical protein
MFECPESDATPATRLVTPQVIMLSIDRFQDSHAGWQDEVFYGGRWHTRSS